MMNRTFYVDKKLQFPMIRELNSILEYLPNLIKLQSWNTLLINKHPPIIHRCSLQIAPDRTLLLHKVFHTNEQPLMHSHSWDLACKVLQGEYEMGVGFSSDRNIIPPSIYKTIVKFGDIYEMTSSDIWHYTKPLTPYSYSVILIGERTRERRAENILPLPAKDKVDMMKWFATYFDI